MTLHDQHLQKALQHAPDRELTPSDATRHAVLTYANKTLKQHQETWLSRISGMLSSWFGSNWHLAGVGSAVATLLIVVVFWHELPESTMWEASAPADSAETKIAEAAMDDKDLEKRLSDKGSSEKESTKENLEDKASINQTQSKAKAALPATTANGAIVASTDQPSLKNKALAKAERETDQLAKKSEVPAAAIPPPVVEDKLAVANAPAAVANPGENAAPAVKGDAATERQAEGDADLRVRRQDNVAKKSTSIAAARGEVENNATSPATLGAAMPEVVSQNEDSRTLLETIKKEGGKATANKDIQAGKLRLLEIQDLSVTGADPLNCPQSTPRHSAIDAQTAYKIESIDVCNPSILLQREVEVYNQAMRDWHAKNSR